VPGPFLTGLLYSLPAALPEPLPGSRVWVPLGRRKIVGVVLGLCTEHDIDLAKLKAIIAIIDTAPLFCGALLKLMHWLSQYYQSALILTTRHKTMAQYQ